MQLRVVPDGVTDREKGRKTRRVKRGERRCLSSRGPSLVHALIRNDFEGVEGRNSVRLRKRVDGLSWLTDVLKRVHQKRDTSQHGRSLVFAT